jgi:hypothetical protein
LYRVGHEVYLPMTVVRRRDRSTSRYSLVQVPLFSSYLFIAHAPGSPWRGIRGAPGVGKLLLDGLKPQYARIGVVEMLQATEETRRDPAPQPVWKPGTARMIDGGAATGTTLAALTAALPAEATPAATCCWEEKPVGWGRLKVCGQPVVPGRPWCATHVRAHEIGKRLQRR